MTGGRVWHEVCHGKNGSVPFCRGGEGKARNGVRFFWFGTVLALGK